MANIIHAFLLIRKEDRSATAKKAGFPNSNTEEPLTERKNSYRPAQTAGTQPKNKSSYLTLLMKLFCITFSLKHARFCPKSINTCKLQRELF
jgi:hypothetical protein